MNKLSQKHKPKRNLQNIIKDFMNKENNMYIQCYMKIPKQWLINSTMKD